MAGDVYPALSYRVKPGLAEGRGVWEKHAVDAAGQYRQLVRLGRAGFLAAAAPAALVRHRIAVDVAAASGSATLTLDQDGDIDETLPVSLDPNSPGGAELEVFPVVKKSGASFADRVTIGRTSNNDVVIDDTSVSRLHAYVRRDGASWVFADAGSKNGSWLAGAAAEPRRERPLGSRTILKLGDVELTFYLAADLYAALGGVE